MEPGDVLLFVDCVVHGGERRVISDCHFRKVATEYDRENGVKRLSCTEK
jgi:hypothetical protein